MTGYLDSLYSGDFGLRRSSLRLVLNRVLAIRSRRTRVFGFGDRVTSTLSEGHGNQDVIATLVRQSFYNDNNTRLEDVLDSIAKDTARRAVHLVITDGRRGDGGSANAQWKRVGELARAWSADTSANGSGAGVFGLAAIDAPFHQVRGDKAGCWSRDPGKSFECPLYVIAFAPRSEAEVVLRALREFGHRLYVAPAFSDPLLSLEALPPGGGRTALNIEGGSGRGRPLHLFYSAPNAPPSRPESTLVSVDARLSDGAALYTADDSFDVQMHSAAVVATAARGTWQPVHEASSQWATPHPPRIDSTRRRLQIPMTLKARQGVNKVRYRIDVYSTGRPAWLGLYDAVQQGDSTRTYGLTALFNQLQPVPSTIGSFFISIY